MTPEFWFIVTCIAAVITIFLALKGFFRWVGRSLRSLWRRISRYKPQIPSETLKIVVEPRGCEWRIRKDTEGKDRMQLCADLYVTNLIDKPVHVIRASVRHGCKPGGISKMSGARENPALNTILPNETARYIVHFSIHKKPPKKRGDYMTEISLLDQFSNEHRIRDLRFSYVDDSKIIAAERSKVASKKTERIYEIKDGLEKQIVTILKDEISRYSKFGRSCGGLGSVRIRDLKDTAAAPGQHLGAKLTAIPCNDWLKSGNAMALVRMHDSLETSEDKNRFLDLLYGRISRDLEYCKIGYFIVFVLYKLGDLLPALSLAKEKLIGDDEHGFSNVLILFNCLLIYEHHNFSNAMLDDLERCLEDVQEHKFTINERILDIRASRITTDRV